jgi:hypothetical protein
MIGQSRSEQEGETKTYTDGKERDRLVDPPKGRNIDGLSSNGSGGTDSGGVLSGSGVDDGCTESKVTFQQAGKVEREGGSSRGVAKGSAEGGTARGAGMEWMGPAPSTRTWMGLRSVRRWTISKA